MPQDHPQDILAELEKLGRNPARLTAFAPALRATLQSIAHDHLIARRLDHLLEAEDWRRCRNTAGALLQAAQDVR